MSELPDSVKRSMRTVLTDFDLSMIVSVPTSRRPIDFGSMLYFSRRLETTVNIIVSIAGVDDPPQRTHRIMLRS